MLGPMYSSGCVPWTKKGDYNGWFCPCHGSHYDTSQEELEKDQHQQIWKCLNTNLLMQIQLKLDNNYE